MLTTHSKKTTPWMASALCAAALMASGGASAQAAVGSPAPGFTAIDTSGKSVALSDFKGKYVVIEWTNPECPFVAKHYNSGNMPATQKEAIAKGAAWVSVQTAPKSASALQAWLQSQHASPTATVLDTDGKIARSYRATTTPHMYIIDPKGTLIYAGAIDSKPSVDQADIKTATNYVSQALGEALSGKAVSKANTAAYGCSVKYPS